MTLAIEPLWDSVLIEPVTKVGALHLPDGGNDLLRRGLIVAVGDGVRRLKVGDEVFWAIRGRADGSEAVHFEGKDYVLCQAEAVLARVKKTTEGA